MPDLNRTQFKDVDPHQQALPGMEEHAHPWAGPLSRGYMLHWHGGREHELQAVEPDHDPRRDNPEASLSWDTQHGTHPGEVSYVTNPAGRHSERGRGLAGALFHSAHHFNFGQSTVPIHSPVLTDAGEHFASKVRPELRPHIFWNTAKNSMTSFSGERSSETEPKWNLPEDFHPYQQEATAKQRAVASTMRKPKPPKGQGKLF
jgi:hypothetical protein